MVSRFRTFTSIIFLTFFISQIAEARSRIGAGVMVGDPNGISFKYGMKSKNAIDAGLAWTGKVDMHFHADYLWQHNGFLKSGRESFDAFWGIGGRIRELDEKEFKEKDDDETKLGARVPIGARWLATRVPLEIFTEVALIVDITPDFDASFDGGFGARWFFD